MHMEHRTFICILLFLLPVHIATVYCSGENERKPYIVYLGDAPDSSRAATLSHHGILSSEIDGQNAGELMIHSYTKSFNAFAARLLPEEANRLSGKSDVLNVFPSIVYKLHTTRSWDFLGFPHTVKRTAKESDIVVGMIDSGIWPSSPSFSDEGFGPPPARWKGKCRNTKDFACNNKVIGARYYRFESELQPGEIDSPVDTEGHGSHTASTVTGASVQHASLYGLGAGTSRGAVPSARLAVYKACWVGGCYSTDLLAALDDAIDDGVDILSVSLGGPPDDYYDDVLAIGSFHAMRKSILTCFSAGNDGPSMSTVTNIAPWAMTVAASSIDRHFSTKVGLGNGQMVKSLSINTFTMTKKMYPLITGADAANKANNASSDYASYCLEGLDKNKVEGKIVLCDMAYTGALVKLLGGAGIIMSNNLYTDAASITGSFPSTMIDLRTGTTVHKYYNSTKAPYAVIYKSEAKNTTKPFVASFSSRGPNSVSRNVLKPDITAPGIEILASWTRLSSVTGDVGDKRLSSFNIISGTSMACPHVSGAAAYVKSFHRQWSPAAIKSALMTTAKHIGISKYCKNGEMEYGSGQIDPVKALDPGLVYDLDEASYIQFLCKEGYNAKKLRPLVGNRTSCGTYPHRNLGSDGLNYPSMYHTQQSGKQRIEAIFRRTVTNVGKPDSVYIAAVESPKWLSVEVFPSRLVFSRLGQKRSFKVVAKGRSMGDKQAVSATLVWSDSVHTVRSPVVFAQNITTF